MLGIIGEGAIQLTLTLLSLGLVPILGLIALSNNSFKNQATLYCSAAFPLSHITISLDFHTENISKALHNMFFGKNIIIFCFFKATFLLCYKILSNHEPTKQ